MLISIDKGFDYFYITTAETLEITNLNYVDYNSLTLEIIYICWKIRL